MKLTVDHTIIKIASVRVAKSLRDQAREVQRKYDDLGREVRELADRVDKAWTLFS